MRRAYPCYRDSGVDWLGQVPAYWEVRKLNRVCRFAYGDTLISEQRSEGGVPVFGSNGPLDWHDKANTLAPVIVIGRKGSFGQVKFSRRPVYSIDTTYFVDQRSTGSYLRWLYYALLCADLADTTMDSAVPGLSREHAYGKYLPLPNREDQKAIAAFLDRETARIDKLVEKNRLLIERLAEYRTAMITRAVTRGLDASAPLKPSGVDWLGDIPEHWEVCRLKHLAGLSAGTNIVSEDIQEFGDYPVFGGNGIRGYTSLFTHYGEYPLIGRQGALCGVVNYASGRFWASEHAIVVDSLSGVMPVWLTFTLEFLALNRLSQSAAQPGLAVDKVGAVPSPLPPLDEQRAIADHIDREAEHIDALTSKAETAIERLQEYRAALITAAVTGKIDVREPEQVP